MGNVQIVKASAGSGKTYRLAYEYVRNVIDDPGRYRHILAVTFTNKATEEMKQRIVSEIHRLASDEPSSYMGDLTSELGLDERTIRIRAHDARTRILHDYSRFAVLTIDKFFQRIIRSFIRELGIDLNFNLELQTDNLLGKAADGVIDALTTDDMLKQWIADFVEEKIAENRRWDIKSGLAQLGRELFKEGYKKIARSADESSADAREKLAAIVARTRRQAQEATERMQRTAQQALDVISDGGLMPSDFSGGRYSFTNWFAKMAAGEIDSYGKAVVNALESDEKWYAKTSPNRETIIELIPHLRPLLCDLVEQFDKNIRLLNSAVLLRENFRNFALLNDLAAQIDAICEHDNILPISETNHILHQLVAGNDTPFIFEKSGNHFTHFMIDEFQDTSSMQWENFVPLLENAVAQSETSPVMLVGDVKQSIYRWRGGDWRILAEGIEERFGAVERCELTTNHRSLRNVVTFNNLVIGGCVRIDNDRLNGMVSEAAERDFIPSAARDRLTNLLADAYEGHTQAPRSDDPQGFIQITQYEKLNEAGEEVLPPVIDRIERLQDRGFAPSEIAILVRYNYEGIRIANMLLEHKSRHPDSAYSYDVMTAEALTIGSAPVSGFIAACLGLSVSPADAIRLAVYNRWLGLPFDARPDVTEAAFLASLRTESPEGAFEKILIRHRLADDPAHIAYIQAFHDQVIGFSTSKIADIPLFLQWWDENGKSQSIHMPQNGSAITIITVHKAKGLQYKAVVIPYCNWDLNPHWRTILWADGTRTPFDGLTHIPVGFKKIMGESHFAEAYYDELVMGHIDNINTFYVAATRAEEELHIMMPADKGVTPRIGRLLLDSIEVSGDTASIGVGEDGTMNGIAAMTGRVEQTDHGLEISFGDPVERRRVAKSDDESCRVLRYPSREPAAKVRQRLVTQRYFDREDGVPPVLAPRNYGILMHRIFERAESPEDVDTALLTMLESGVIAAHEAEQLTRIVSRAFADDTIRSWFSGSWDSVRNENEIIIPGSPTLRRPDRVMLRGTQAVVVDYKFGLLRSASHARQIHEYMRLLCDMGYADVQGYIWYVSLEDVEPVEM